MGVVAERIGYLAAGEELGLGRLAPDRIDVSGEKLGAVTRRFVLPPGSST